MENGILKYVFTPVYDDEADKAAREAEIKTAVDKAVADATKGTFNQDQVNDFLAKEKGKLQKKYETRIESLEKLKENANL